MLATRRGEHAAAIDAFKVLASDYEALGACAAEESAQRRHVLKAPLLIDWHAARCTGGS
jgi:hypothetical protein